jgi:hypothetical protein
MYVIERRQYEVLVRVRRFAETYGHLFPASSVARQDLAAVDAAVKELDAQQVTLIAASVSARAHRKTAARKALLARLLAISQTARVLAKDTPGLEQQFQVPHTAPDQTLLATGRKFARGAEPLVDRFVARGMSATFIADLNALVADLERAMHDRGLGREARRAARASTKAALRSGLDAVRSLDAIVTNHLRDDEVARTMWERERRIVYPKRGETMPEPAAAASEPPTDDKAA